MSVSCECCQVSASGWSLVQRSPTECGVSECDREASIMRRPWPTRGCCAPGGGGRTNAVVTNWLWLQPQALSSVLYRVLLRKILTSSEFCGFNCGVSVDSVMWLCMAGQVVPHVSKENVVVHLIRELGCFETSGTTHQKPQNHGVTSQESVILHKVCVITPTYRC
jgi:hypothetical protein